MKITRHILFYFFVSFFTTTSVYAEISASLSLDPINPEPKSQVEITLESYSFNPNTATITWKINNTVVLKGLGEKTLTIKTGNVGDVTDVDVVAETAEGDSIEQHISITPSSVVLLYEAPMSYVPPFYNGRSLPSTGALVRVSAIPEMSEQGTALTPSSLAFTWYLNDEVMKSMSGTGKQSALIRLDYLKNKNEVKVVVRSPRGLVSSKTVTVPSHSIMPLVYLNDPIFGTDFKKVLERRFESVGDFAISLEPFYVSTQNEGEKNPTFSWFLDGLPSTPLGGRVLGLHPKDNSEGRKLLTIKVTGPDRRIQQAETKLELLFDTRK